MSIIPNSTVPTTTNESQDANSNLQSTIFRLRNDRMILNEPSVTKENHRIPLLSFVYIFSVFATYLLVVGIVGIVLILVGLHKLETSRLIRKESQQGIETAKFVVSNNRWLNCDNICGNSDPHRVVTILYGESKYPTKSQTAKCLKSPGELPVVLNNWSPCVKNTKYRIRDIPRNFSLVRFDASDVHSLFVKEVC